MELGVKYHKKKAPGVFISGSFIATLDVSDFIISSKSKIGNLIT
jgi:hypothetical protein